MPATLLDIVDLKKHIQKEKSHTFTFCLLKMYSFGEDFFFSIFLCSFQTAKLKNGRLKREVTLTRNRKMATVWFSRGHIRVKSILGSVLWIYIEIWPIFCIYLFCLRRGLPCVSQKGSRPIFWTHRSTTNSSGRDWMEALLALWLADALDGKQEGTLPNQTSDKSILI